MELKNVAVLITGGGSGLGEATARAMQEFNEVYFTDVVIPDSQRLGAVGEGWSVSLTTLMNERMSQIQKIFLGAVAIAATLGAVQVGAVQLASGHDLADRWQAVADKPGHNVNRASKADRLAEVKAAPVPTRTVSMRLNDLADTSVLLRVPAVIETGNAKPPPVLLKGKDQKQGRPKPTIACEPMVSSLTEVARLLQPGRCVT